MSSGGDPRRFALRVALAVTAVLAVGLAIAVPTGLGPFGDDDGAPGGGPDVVDSRDGSSRGTGPGEDEDDGGASGGAAGAPGRLESRAVVGRANEICHDANLAAERRAARDLRGSAEGEASRAELRRFLDGRAEVYSAAIDDLAALSPGGEDGVGLARLVAEGRHGVRRLREPGDPREVIASGNPFTSFNETALALGLAECAR